MNKFLFYINGFLESLDIPTISKPKPDYRKARHSIKKTSEQTQFNKEE